MKLHAPLLPLVGWLMAGILLSGLLTDWKTGLFILIPAIVVACLTARWKQVQQVVIWGCMVLMGMTLGARQQGADYQRRSTNATAQEWRQQLLERYKQWGLPDEAYGVVAAMTLGEKESLDAEVKDTFSKVGAAHILALSGLHLMILYTFITLFVAWRRFRMLSQVVIVTAIWTFAFLVGMTPSIVRSATMITIYALLSLGHRQKLSVNILALTAIIMLVVQPQSLYDIGFQLSFMAVLAILLFNPLFSRLIPLHVLQRHRWLNALWGMTTVSLSAQMGTAPLVAFYFGRFSTYFLLANYVVIPLATAILYLALACILTGWWTALQQLLATVLSAVVILMNRLLDAIAHLPYCSIEGLLPFFWQVALIYIFIGCGYVVLSLTLPKSRQSA